MDFDYSPKPRNCRRLLKFMDEHIYPAKPTMPTRCGQHGRRQALDAAADHRKLKPKAQAAGLWNLFLPVDSAEASGYHGAGLTNQEYAPLAEIMGRVPWASEVFNCSAPDTGNMETIARYGSEARALAQAPARRQDPLGLRHDRARRGLADATNIETRIERQGDEYVINGRKWWISGRRPALRRLHHHGQDRPRSAKHSQQSMILVPADTPGIKIVRPLNVFGYDDAPHGHVEMCSRTCACPSQHPAGRRPRLRDRPGRLGPGRIHHCMRLIGLAERALELMCKRASSRVAFGKAWPSRP
jgi:acyl-CoA dehydrogenase